MPVRNGNVAILGFGTMGSGIAQVCAAAGYPVVVLEADQARLDVGWAALTSFLEGGVRRGKVSSAERDAIVGRISGTTEMKDLETSWLVIEAVSEDLELKKSLLRRLEAVVSENALIATNTSALSVTAIGAALSQRGRFGGLHFFNPAPIMSLVEVVYAHPTDANTVGRLVEFAESIRKDPVIVADRPGFLLNRLLMPYLNDVIQAYDDGLASAEDLDLAIELGLGYPMGPLKLLDLIGLDTHLHATESAYGASFTATFAPPPLLRSMVEAGYLGHKSGRGFRLGTPEGASWGT